MAHRDLRKVRTSSAAALPAEQGVEQALRFPQSFLRKQDRLGLPGWIGDIAFLMKPAHDFPVEAFPGPITLVATLVMLQIRDSNCDFSYWD